MRLHDRLTRIKVISQNAQSLTFCLCCSKLGLKRYSSLWEARLRATERHLPYGITRLVATGHRWTPPPLLTSARQTGTPFAYPGKMEGWVDLGARYIRKWFTCPHWPAGTWSRPDWKLNLHSLLLEYPSVTLLTKAPNDCCALPLQVLHNAESSVGHVTGRSSSRTGWHW